MGDRTEYDRKRYARLKHEYYDNEPWRALVNAARTRAKNKNLEFDLDNEWGERVWTGRCAITGIEFVPSFNGGGPNPRSPSIDRIVNTAGYVKSNCRFVLHGVNALKANSTDEEMVTIARAIAAAPPLAAPNTIT